MDKKEQYEKGWINKYYILILIKLTDSFIIIVRQIIIDKIF